MRWLVSSPCIGRIAGEYSSINQLIGENDMASLKAKYENVKRSVARMKERGEETIGHVVQTVEVNATAGGLAYLRGRIGEVDDSGNKQLSVAGVPVGLAFGVLSHVAAFTPIAGKYTEHMHNIGDGALAEFMVSRLFTIGEEAASEVSTKGVGRRHLNGVRGMPNMGAAGYPAWSNSWQSPVAAHL